MGTNLVDYARSELTILGEDPDTIDKYLKVIEAFSDMGHSGGSYVVAAKVVCDLCQYIPLTALTDDPAEWMLVDESGDSNSMWQSRRNPAAFSRDAGKTYYLVGDSATVFISKVSTQ